jgi:hypothetical protein
MIVTGTSQPVTAWTSAPVRRAWPAAQRSAATLRTEPSIPTTIGPLSPCSVIALLRPSSAGHRVKVPRSRAARGHPPFPGGSDDVSCADGRRRLRDLRLYQSPAVTPALRVTEM